MNSHDKPRVLRQLSPKSISSYSSGRFNKSDKLVLLNMMQFWMGDVRAELDMTEPKRSVLIQSQREAIPKNAQTTAQLHSSHTLIK